MPFNGASMPPLVVAFVFVLTTAIAIPSLSPVVPAGCRSITYNVIVAASSSPSCVLMVSFI
jgi:hypothetical protein